MFTLTNILWIVGYFASIWLFTVIFSYLDKTHTKEVEKWLTKESIKEFFKVDTK